MKLGVRQEISFEALPCSVRVDSRAEYFETAGETKRRIDESLLQNRSDEQIFDGAK
jgi:hypothetical protein